MATTRLGLYGGPRPALAEEAGGVVKIDGQITRLGLYGGPRPLWGDFTGKTPADAVDVTPDPARPHTLPNINPGFVFDVENISTRELLPDGREIIISARSDTDGVFIGAGARQELTREERVASIQVLAPERLGKQVSRKEATKLADKIILKRNLIRERILCDEELLWILLLCEEI
jgi:hypothetical protein